MININNKDIGAEIISILTKGMYKDPKDALREYIQNSVDADATNVEVKIRRNHIVITDNGKGMDKNKMRDSIRVGISEKNPNQNVGFMGIGIYSAFHLCDKLSIISKTKLDNPHRLTFHFGQMKEFLIEHRQNRINGIEDGASLHKILSEFIELNELDEDSVGFTGTRVQLEKVEPNFFESLSKFEEVSDYIEEVIPLPFHPKFKWKKEIESRLKKFYRDNKKEYRIINVNLEINNAQEQLYRSYENSMFDNDTPLEPIFYELKNKNEILGIAWGCLNSAKSSLKSKFRGFILKKEGFSIGSRHDIQKKFGRPIFFNRYSGEILITNENLLPNAARSNFEYSIYRVILDEELNNLAIYYNKSANDFQEYERAIEDLAEAINDSKKIQGNIEIFRDNPEAIIDYVHDLKQHKSKLENKIKNKKFAYETDDKSSEAKETVNFIKTLIKESNNIILAKKNKKKTKSNASTKKSEKRPDSIDYELKDYDHLIEVINDFGLDFNEEIKIILEKIDEFFIQGKLGNKEYKSKLLEFKEELDNTFTELN